MNMIPLDLSSGFLLAACAIAFGAGVIKGAVGFAMPMIMLSGLSSLLAPDVALAAIILPTFVANMYQATRKGFGTIRETAFEFRVFLLVGAFCLALSAQVVPSIPARELILTIGLCVTGFAIWQLSGVAPQPNSTQRSATLDAIIGACAGTIGGVSGIWGPPTVAYLTAIGTPKHRQMVAQGIIYGLGSALLLIAHLFSGILNPATAPLSALLIAPALLGTALGTRISDRLDQTTFRRITLIVLIFGGLNLLRRGLLG